MPFLVLVLLWLGCGLGTIPLAAAGSPWFGLTLGVALACGYFAGQASRDPGR